jgi:hypothetical protein
MVLAIEGREYKLPPLTMGDIASAERYVIDQRLDNLLARTRMPPLPDDLRAKAIAEVLAKPVLLHEILLSYEGRLRLLYLSMHRADPKISWEFVLHKMPAVPTQVLTSLMYKLAGLGTTEDDEADPTQATTPEPGEPLSDGTKSSPGSVADST